MKLELGNLQNKRIMDIQKTSAKYFKKLQEAGFKIYSHDFQNNIVILTIKSTLPLEKVVGRVKSLLMLEDHHLISSTSSDESIYTLSILVDDSSPLIITDQDRIQNKLTNQHKSSPDKLHIQRFIRTVKDIYNVIISENEYKRLNDNMTKYHFKKIYDINGQVALSSFVYPNAKGENVTIYCIYGNRSDRNKAGFKSAWPSIFEEETLLAVPDKLAIEGVNRQDFTQMVKQTLFDKKKHFETLAIIHKDSTDREIFETDSLEKKEKQILKMYLRHNYVFSLEDAIHFTIEKF